MLSPCPSCTSPIPSGKSSCPHCGHARGPMRSVVTTAAMGATLLGLMVSCGPSEEKTDTETETESGMMDYGTSDPETDTDIETETETDSEMMDYGSSDTDR